MYLIGSIRHREGEVIRMYLFFTGVDVLNVARGEVSLGERADACSCNSIRPQSNSLMTSSPHPVPRSVSNYYVNLFATIINIHRYWYGWIKHTLEILSSAISSSEMRWLMLLARQREKWISFLSRRLAFTAKPRNRVINFCIWANMNVKISN